MTRFNVRRLLFALAAATTLVAGRPALAAEGNLLAGKAPHGRAGVANADRLTDDRAAPEGDFWKTNVTASFRDADAFVIYDLGKVTPVAAAWLQGDNNDRYRIEISPDGGEYQTLWDAPPIGSGAGLRARHTRELNGQGRFVRISATGGDGAFALSEVQLFATVPAVFPPAIKARAGVPEAQLVRGRILIFGVALIVAVLLAFRGAPIWWTLLLLAWPAWAAISAATAFQAALPVDNRVVSLARATWALVAAVVVLRECFPPARFLPDRRVTLGVLGVMAGLSFLSFYNLGQPQFWDASKGRTTFAHYLDLRQYYPTAKYFKELGYRDIYVADMAAYREEPGVDRARVNQMPMRDLDTLSMSTVGEREDEIQRVKSHFTPERWEAYKKDARYFREVMGTPHYLETMHDMGGNATPVWMSIAYLLFNAMPPSNAGFLATAVFDLALLLLTFAMIGRCFGVRTALVAMVIFGSNDFIMYGTNWAGATLRHDWLAYLGLGACALKRERWALGGALLGAAGMIRAFPALAVFGATFPALWRAAEHWQVHRRLPPLRQFLDQNRAVVRIAIGAVGTVLVLFLLSAIILPPKAWLDWLHKVVQLSSDPHPSHISLRSLVAGWEGNQHAILRQRLPVFIAGLVFFVGLVVIAARGKRPDQAAMLALPLIPVLMYPGNYYLHLVFLLPLVVDELRVREPGDVPLAPLGAGVWATLLLMCTAQYGAVLVLPDLPLHFYLNSVLLFAGLTAMLFFLVRERALAAGWWLRAQAS